MTPDKRTADNALFYVPCAAEGLTPSALDHISPWWQSSIELVLGLDISEVPMDTSWALQA